MQMIPNHGSHMRVVNILERLPDVMGVPPALIDWATIDGTKSHSCWATWLWPMEESDVPPQRLHEHMATEDADDMSDLGPF